MTHGEATPKPSNLNDNGIDDSSCFEFHFDIKTFEDRLNNATSHMKDDFSHSSCSSETSCLEFTSLKWIDNLFEEACARLDKKIDKINDSFLAPSHIKGRCDNECARASSTESLQHSDINFYPNVSSKKEPKKDLSSISLKKDLNSEFPSKNSYDVTSCDHCMTSFDHDANSFEHECNVSLVFKNYELDLSTSLDDSIHKKSSFASNNTHFEPHPLEDSFILCL